MDSQTWTSQSPKETEQKNGKLPMILKIKNSTWIIQNWIQNQHDISNLERYC